VTINVTPLDATLSLDSIFCYKNDSLLIKGTVCLQNNYGALKYDLKVNYFDRDSTATGRIELGELILPRTTVFSSGCYSFTHLVKMTRNDRVYAYFNKDLIQYEDTVYNNVDSIRYIPFNVQFQDTLKKVFRGDPNILNFSRQGEPINRLLWTPSTYLTCDNCPSPIIKTNVTQFMKLWATTKYACTDSAYQEVRAFYQSKINLPNVFTPNGDGLNDKFYVIAGVEVKKVKKFQILNRWGELIFEVGDVKPNDYRYSWDGTQKGKQLPQGTYVYYLIIELEDGTVESKKGSITLMR
jgi:gliding motility-associated-like protein